MISCLTQPPVLSMRQAGTWDPLLQCCSACTWTNVSSTYELQRNYKGLKIKLCAGAAGASYRQKDTKRPKKPQLPLLKSWAQKQGVASKSRVLCVTPALNPTRGVGKTPKPPLWLDPWTHPYPHPIKGTSSPLLEVGGGKQGKLLLVFTHPLPPAAAGAPISLA